MSPEIAKRENITPRLAVIINAGSGSADNADLAAQVSAQFSAQGIQPEFCSCAEGEVIRRHAEEALQRGCTIVVAGGGDGTVSTVASVVAGTDAALGILPLGTLNHFAKDLGIPLDLNEAVATIIEGKVVQVDIGELNGRTFINNSSLGLYPKLVRYRDEHQRLGRSKWWAFFKAMLIVLGRYSFLKVRLSADEAEIVRSTPFVFIGNNEYEIQGFSIGTRARIDSGQLSVYLTRRAGRIRLLGLALRGLFGRLRNAVDFDTITTSEVVIDARGRSVQVALDGELFQIQLPLHYRCRRHELRVIVREK
jgi:diacylglycerol kinase family enzyme